MVMTLYKGIPLKLWPSPFHLNEGKGKSGSDSENLTTGSMLVVASCISWSAWFIIQVISFMLRHIYISISVPGGD